MLNVIRLFSYTLFVMAKRIQAHVSLIPDNQRVLDLALVLNSP